MVAHQDVVCWQKDCGDIKRYLHRMVFTQWRDLFDQIQTNGDAMTQDEIIEMARDSGMDLYGLGKDRYRFVHHLEAFAKLVAAKEREACAQVAFSWNHDITDLVAKEIRARGEQT